MFLNNLIRLILPMDKQRLIENTNREFSVKLDKSDPALMIVYLIEQTLDDHTEKLQSLITEAGESLPYLLEIKRQEIDNIANRLINAADHLNLEQSKKAELIYDELTDKLQKEAEEYASQSLMLLTESFEKRLENISTPYILEMEKIAATLNQQQIQFQRAKQQDLWINMAAGLFCGILGGLTMFILIVN